MSDSNLIINSGYQIVATSIYQNERVVKTTYQLTDEIPAIAMGRKNDSALQSAWH